MKRFDRTHLPFTKEMKEEWNNHGFLVIENFYSKGECDNLRNKYTNEKDEKKLKFLDEINDFVMSVEKKYEEA